MFCSVCPFRHDYFVFVGERFESGVFVFLYMSQGFGSMSPNLSSFISYESWVFYCFSNFLFFVLVHACAYSSESMSVYVCVRVYISEKNRNFV